MSAKPAIVLYRDTLLQYPETFIRAQSEGLQRFTPYYVGSRRVEGLPLPVERTIVVNQGGVVGKLREILYKLWGIAPACIVGYRS